MQECGVRSGWSLGIILHAYLAGRQIMPEKQDRSVSEHDWHSPSYVDWWIARDQNRDAVRRQRLKEMLAHANVAQDAAISVLDVGGGYGVVTEEILSTFPHARVTLQDYSEPMLAEAHQRLAPYPGRTEFVLADLRDPAWIDRVGGPFDLAVSAIAIHNLRDIEAIAACYRGIGRVLKPGGIFLDYDLFFESIGGLAHHLHLLQEAGFARVDCLWQEAPLASLVARHEPGSAG
jgi:ubiquinone/menaquinone biosynthesis C-methylase UbiE